MPRQFERFYIAKTRSQHNVKIKSGKFSLFNQNPLNLGPIKIGSILKSRKEHDSNGNNKSTEIIKQILNIDFEDSKISEF